jgi:hypothetical protein
VKLSIRKAGEIVRKLWRLAAVGVAAAALAAGLVVTAMPAGAPAHRTIQVTQSQGHIVTASCTTARNYRGGWFTVTYCNGQYYRYACNIGDSGDLFGPLYAANGCVTQVAMHATDGYTLCVSPQTSTDSLHRDYDSYHIRSSTSRCPLASIRPTE